MAHIVLLRHAQATFFGASYDALSELGRRQARALGEQWASAGITFERVCIGPLRRHSETLHEIDAAYRDAGESLPQAELLPLLDEHHGVQVAAHALGRDPQHSGAMHPRDAVAGDEQERLRKEYFTQFRGILLRWAGGELGVPGVESFAAFRERAASVLSSLHRDRSARVLAVSSGGLASMVVGRLLDLSNEQVIDLNLLLRNCATTEFLLSGTRRSLLCFNALDPAVARVGETFA